jgi:hypothetical protein
LWNAWPDRSSIAAFEYWASDRQKS